MDTPGEQSNDRRVQRLGAQPVDLSTSAASSHLTNQQDKQAKVLLWSTPRSLSTVLTKCLSFVPDSAIWHEPYVGAMWYGLDARYHPPSSPKLWKGPPGTDLQTQAETIQLPPNEGYDARQSSYGWCKQQLEAYYPGKKVVFAKDLCRSIATRFDAIPRGYKHTFLIRHPLKVLLSWKKNIYQEATDGPYETFKLTKCEESRVPSGFFFKEAYDLYMHVKENYDPEPIIIDADDLLTNPGAILQAYCESVGIPYSDDLLQWDSSEEVTLHWNVRHILLQLHRLDSFKFNDNAFKSSEFFKPSKGPSRDDLSDDDLYCVDFSMPFYEKMYEKRLRCMAMC